ncbi:NAD(P)-dependent oxidoreductase [Herbaspirillum sp.]|uniref:NAD-dependent epimerase/dehydratase family protein n=1 Tax=Herbaspirillum sp. TaxID=1890675 RepID=UPI001B11822D|nr:NAD(P)-dependent oxidoreductase [Herbaspirillum sp.]MBO9536962.1 NAD(P)-dependent oxidoreductase [Herbaspirillum sp.]
MSNKKSVLVTGGNGLLGRQLSSALVATNHDVFALVHRSPPNPIAGVNYCVVDLSTEWPETELPSQIDAIVHLAQSAHFREVPTKALDVFTVNVASTARLLDFAHRIGTKQFLYASSGGVYGAGEKAFHENSPINAPGHLGYYLGSKLSGEILSQSYAAHMQIMVLRFFFIYGQMQNRAMLLPRLVDSIKEGRNISLQGSEGLRINPIHVSDASQAVVAALNTTESATYNIAGAEIYSLRALCSKIETMVGRTGQYIQAPGTPLDVIGDISAMRSRLHEPKVGIVDGLKELI